MEEIARYKLENPVNEEGLPRVLSVEQAASVIGISKTKMYQVLHSDHAPDHIRIGNGKRGAVRIGRDSLYRWLDDVMEKRLSI